MTVVWLGVVALICAGAALAVQAPINAALSRGLGDATLASAANFLVGFLVMAAVCVLRGAWPGAGAVGPVPLWAWVGGSMGAFYITVLILAVPLTGALTAAAATILPAVRYSGKILRRAEGAAQVGKEHTDLALLAAYAFGLCDCAHRVGAGRNQRHD
jgi:transporter family-2 protein